MQRTICTLPDEDSIFAYICHGLSKVPGISDVRHSCHGTESDDASLLRFPLQIGIASKEELQVRIADPLVFEPYEKYLQGFCSMVAVILEGHHARRLSESHQVQLEHRIQDLIRQFRTESAERRLAENSLRESERKFRLFVETAQEGICAQDPQFVITYVNDKMADILGYEVAEMMNQPFTEFMFAEDFPAHDEMIHRRMSGTSEHYERRLRHKDGTERWLIVSATPFKDVNEEYEGSIALFTDITERKRNLLALEQASVLMRNILDSTNDLVFVKDQELRMILCNNAYSRAVGSSCSELYGKTDLENGFDPADVRGDSSRGIRGFEQDEQEVLAGNTVHRHNDSAVVAGRLHIYDTMKFPLKNDRGEVIGVVSVSRDITERKKGEEELRHNRNMLAYVVESIPQAVFWKDCNSVYLGCNKVFATVAGIGRPEDIVGKTDFDLPWSQEEAEIYRTHDHEVLQGNQATRYVIEATRPAGGSPYWINTTKIPLTDAEGRVYGILGVCENFADRRSKPRTP